jgi:hypothetical protein
VGLISFFLIRVVFLLMAFTQLYSYFVLARKTNNLKIATIGRYSGENKNHSLNISNINFHSWNWISSSAPMERRKSVYVKFIETFWIWQDVYGINDSR